MRQNPIWPNETQRALTDRLTDLYLCTTDIWTQAESHRTLTGPNLTHQTLPPDRVRQWADDVVVVIHGVDNVFAHAAPVDGGR